VLDIEREGVASSSLISGMAIVAAPLLEDRINVADLPDFFV